MAGARRRIYSPTSPLYAREDLRFSGRPVATRAVVPEEYFSSARQRRIQWDHRKVDHEEDLPKKRAPLPPAPTALPAVTVQPGSVVPVIIVGDSEPIDESQLAAVKAKLDGITETPVVNLSGEAVRGQPHPGRHKRR